VTEETGGQNEAYCLTISTSQRSNAQQEETLSPVAPDRYGPALFNQDTQLHTLPSSSSQLQIWPKCFGMLLLASDVSDVLAAYMSRLPYERGEE
jgi:hypothetical protein